jgi:hypothetical protein
LSAKAAAAASAATPLGAAAASLYHLHVERDGAALDFPRFTVFLPSRRLKFETKYLQTSH